MVEQIKFGITFRHNYYSDNEVGNFIECVDGIKPIELKHRYTEFLWSLRNREIKKSTMVDRDVLVEFANDLDNRADIDYRAGHNEHDPEITRGGKTFDKYYWQLKDHLEGKVD